MVKVRRLNFIIDLHGDKQALIHQLYYYLPQQG